MNNSVGFGYLWILGIFGYFIGRFVWRYWRNKKIQSETPHNLCEKGKIQLEKGKLKEGVNYFSRTIKMYPDYLDAYIQQASTIINFENLLEGKKSLLVAVTDLSFVLERTPEDSKIYQYRGMAYLHLEEGKKALDDLNKAIELQPDSGKYHTTRSAIYFLLDDIEKAINDATRAIELGDKESGFHSRSAYYRYKGEFKLAIEDLTNAVELNPRRGDYYYWKGALFEKIGNFEQARANLIESINKGLIPGMNLAAKELLIKLDNARS